MQEKKITKSFWLKLFIAPILMFAFAFALVPIYDVLCELTGFNGTSGRIYNEVQYDINEKRLVNIDFFAMTMPGFSVKFYPKIKSMNINPGKFYTASYIAENNTNTTIIGQAVPSVAPNDAARHFKKLECFCFNKQVFKPQQKIEMTLRFVIEPELDERIKDISLSYNFFKIES